MRCFFCPIHLLENSLFWETMKATVRIFLQMVDFPFKYAYLHQFLKHSICAQQTRAVLQKRSAEKKLNDYLEHLF